MRILKGKGFWIVGAAFVLLAGALGASAWYGNEKITELSNKITELSTTLASTTSLLKDDIAAAQEKVDATLLSERQNVDAQIGNVSQQVGTISGTVNTLQKLSKTDPELLAKYSKVYFLNEHYAPERVTQIP
jgi:hypothetical protein